MQGSFTARSAVLLLLAVLVIGSGLVWWLLNHPEWTKTSTVQSTPPAEAKRDAPAASAEKPASNSITAATEALKDLGGQLGALKPAPSEPGPQFDIARIEPNGESVIAGRATPNATVELLLDDTVHDKTVADATGAFVFVPKPLPPGKFNLRLRATEPGGKQMVSKNSVAVELAAPAQEKPAVAVAQKVRALQAAVAPKEQVAALPEPKRGAEANVRIDLVEAQEGGKLYVSGRSAPGATVRLYLNDAYIATGTASPNGQISFHIVGGVKPGEYRIRLDQLAAASDKVLSRAEAPFNAPATVVASAPARAAAPGGSAPAASTPSSPSVAAETKASPKNEAASAVPPVARAVDAPQAPTEAPQPTRPERATPPELAAKAPSGPQAVAAPRDIASAATSPSAQQPASSAPASKDSRSLPSKQQDAAQANRLELANEKPETAASAKPAVASGRRDAVVVPSIDTKVVIRGDNLWRISRTTYGHGIRYTVIYKANRDQIRDPDLIYPGQIFVLPKAQP